MKPNSTIPESTNPKPPQAKIAALILAGGRGERMGRIDKAQIKYKGRSLVDIVSEDLRHECDHIYISRQKDQDDLSQYGTVLIDVDADQGPLAGLVTACKRAKDDGFDYLLSVPVDTAVLPNSLGQRLFEARKTHAVVVVNDIYQATISLIDLSDMDHIVRVYEKGTRSLKSWIVPEKTGFLIINPEELNNINNM